MMYHYRCKTPGTYYSYYSYDLKIYLRNAGIKGVELSDVYMINVKPRNLSREYTEESNFPGTYSRNLA